MGYLRGVLSSNLRYNLVREDFVREEPPRPLRGAVDAELLQAGVPAAVNEG